MDSVTVQANPIETLATLSDGVRAGQVWQAVYMRQCTKTWSYTGYVVKVSKRGIATFLVLDDDNPATVGTVIKPSSSFLEECGKRVA